MTSRQERIAAGRSSDSDARSPARGDSTRRTLGRADWEQAMNRLRICSRLLTMVLLALVVRALVSGVTPAVGWSAAIIALLLLASLLLTAHGRRLDPDRPRQPPVRSGTR
jgi:hypothetical protein